MSGGRPGRLRALRRFGRLVLAVRVLIWISCMGACACVAGWGSSGISGRMVAYGAQESELSLDPEVQAGWEDIDRFLREETDGIGPELSFSALVKALMAQDADAATKILLKAAEETLFGEIRRSGHLAGQLLALGVIGAIFSGFSEIFSENQISETGFFMTYLLAFTVLAASFYDSTRIAAQVLERQAMFMKVLLPSYFLAVAWAGSSVTSAAWYEFVLFLIAAVQWLYLNLLTPLVRVYILLVLAGNMAKEEMLSHMTSLLKTAVCYGTRSLLGVVMGFQLIQGMVLPYADAVRSVGVQKLLQVIPGIGQGAGAVTKLILGSGVLIKNTMGAAAVFFLLLISLLPILKLAVILMLYRGIAAVLEPIADKRLVGCILGVAEGQKMLLGLAASGLLLFVLTIALICTGTNVSYLA
ncbi:MAG: stage III sporulation protein AE [Lachnospiraceae bacterium]|nr:stage III sporulation protein AE [Lachnospiraceae bacterium]